MQIAKATLIVLATIVGVLLALWFLAWLVLVAQPAVIMAIIVMLVGYGLYGLRTPT